MNGIYHCRHLGTGLASRLERAIDVVLPGGGGGGMLGGFLNSGFGRAMEMGAGIGLDGDLINSIF